MGRERPLENGRGTEIGGKRRGSLTPQLPHRCVATLTATTTRGGAERRRCVRRSRRQATTCTNRIVQSIAQHADRFERGMRIARGEHRSEVCVPPDLAFNSTEVTQPGARNLVSSRSSWSSSTASTEPPNSSRSRRRGAVSRKLGNGCWTHETALPVIRSSRRPWLA